jgi:hypothetical protein
VVTVARDRDHLAVAEQTRKDGQRLLQAWEDYRAKAQALGAIVQCCSVWPDLLEDEGIRVSCDLLDGHPAGEDDGGHRHRLGGSQVTVTW